MTPPEISVPIDANCSMQNVPGVLKLQQWTPTLDALRQECDGMSRCVSTLLTREAIPHTIHVGHVQAHTTGGRISTHLWIELEQGVLFDLRARMWLGNDPSIPHGVFRPTGAVEYISKGVIPSDGFRYSTGLFEVLAEAPLGAFP